MTKRANGNGIFAGDLANMLRKNMTGPEIMAQLSANRKAGKYPDLNAKWVREVLVFNKIVI